MPQPDDNNLADEFVALMATPLDRVRIFTDTERNYVLTVYPDGTRELATRDAYRRFLPPIQLHPEPVAELLAGANADCALLDEMGR